MAGGFTKLNVDYLTISSLVKIQLCFKYLIFYVSFSIVSFIVLRFNLNEYKTSYQICNFCKTSLCVIYCNLILMRTDITF